MLAFELMDVTMARQMMQWWVCRGEIYIIINMYFSLVIRDSLFKSVAYTENTNSSNLLSKCLTINDPKREVQLPEVTAIEIKDVPHVHPHVCPIMAVPNSTQFVLQLGGHVSMQLGTGGRAEIRASKGKCPASYHLFSMASSCIIYFIY